MNIAQRLFKTQYKLKMKELFIINFIKILCRKQRNEESLDKMNDYRCQMLRKELAITQNMLWCILKERVVSIDFSNAISATIFYGYIGLRI